MEITALKGPVSLLPAPPALKGAGVPVRDGPPPKLKPPNRSVTLDPGCWTWEPAIAL